MIFSIRVIGEFKIDLLPLSYENYLAKGHICFWRVIITFSKIRSIYFKCISEPFIEGLTCLCINVYIWFYIRNSAVPRLQVIGEIFWNRDISIRKDWLLYLIHTRHLTGLDDYWNYIIELWWQCIRIWQMYFEEFWCWKA